MYSFPNFGASLIAQLVKKSACDAGDPSLIPGSGRSSGEGIGYPLQYLGLPCGSADKGSAYSAGDLGSISGLGGSPGEGKVYALQYSGLENSRPWDYSPWGRKELDMTERLSLSQFLTSQWFHVQL